MSGEDAADAGTSRDPGRTAIAVACIVGLVLAASLLAGVHAAPGDGDGPSRSGNVSGGGNGTATTTREGATNRSAGTPDNRTSGSSESPREPPNGSAGRSGASGKSGGASAGGVLNAPRTTSIAGSLEESLRNTSGKPVFVVESDRATYWRTMAYDAYTGSGWRQTGTIRGYDGSLEPPVESTGIIRQRYRLYRPTTAPPSAWKPVSVTGPFVPRLNVTDAGSFRTGRPTERNATYEVVSYATPRDPAVLRAAGRDYPEPIHNEYATLPETVPESLGAFTARITRNASTPYGVAKRIENWLESHKEYSLAVDRNGTENIAAQFVFRMEKGYCQYFATSMVVMLRTQGIPARYVVGYSTGEPVGNDTYLVRGMNAHAWVEVYFPDVGWVRFDPTPGSARMATERKALKRQDRNASGYDHTETGSPGEQFSADGPVKSGTAGGNRTATRSGNRTGPKTGDRTGGRNTTGGNVTRPENTTIGNATGTGTANGSELDDSENETTDDVTDGHDAGVRTQVRTAIGPLNLSIAPEPIPGRLVVVSTTRNGSAVEGIEIRFNGDPVGVTNASGLLRARVPYAARLNVTARVAAGGDAPLEVGATSADGVSVVGGHTGSTRLVDENDTRTFDLETTIDVSLLDDPVPGANTTIRATIRGVPVRNGAVRIEGEVVTRTDENGTATIILPYRENVTIEVRRGETRGDRTVELPTTITLTPTEPVVPGRNLTVEATVRGQPVANATVTRDGVRTGRTDENGTIRVPIRYRNTTRVTAFRWAARGSRIIDIPTEIDINTNDPPIPGTEMTVTATIVGRAVAGARVIQDARPAGRTGANGSIELVVPYRETTTAVVLKGAARGKRIIDLRTNATIRLRNDPVPGTTLALRVTVAGKPVTNATVLTNGSAVATTGRDGSARITPPFVDAIRLTAERGAVDGNRTVALPTNATVRIEEPVIPGETTTVTARIAGEPLPGAIVSLNGTGVTNTSPRGTAEIEVPFRDALRVVVERGAVSGRNVTTIPPLNVSVDPRLPAALPGLPVTVTVTVSGEPVRGATVTVGQKTTTTGADGQAKVDLPIANAVTITVERGELRVTRDIDGLFVPVGIVGGGLLLFVGGSLAIRRFGPAGSRIVRGALAPLIRVARGLFAVFVAATGRLDALLTVVVTRVRWLVTRFRAARGWLGDLPSPHVLALVAGHRLRRWIEERYRRVLEWLQWRYDRLRRQVVSVWSDTETGVRGAAGDGQSAGEPSGDETRLTIREAFHRMAERLRVRRRETKTPGELSRRAIDAGLPRESVRTLTRAFREAEYGHTAPSEGRIEQVRAAIERIEGAETDREDGKSDGSSGGEGR